jgi:hypothetical protein
VEEAQDLAAAEAAEAAELAEAAEANASESVGQGDVTAEVQENQGKPEEADAQQPAQADHTLLQQEQSAQEHAMDQAQERIQETGVQLQAEGHVNAPGDPVSAEEQKDTDVQVVPSTIQQDPSGQEEKKLGDLLDDAEMTEDQNALVPPMTSAPLPGGMQDPVAQSSNLQDPAVQSSKE